MTLDDGRGGDPPPPGAAAEEVFLQQEHNEIHARSLYYHAAEPGRLGQALAQGPGWFRGQSVETGGRIAEAVWNEQLRIAPSEHNHLISLTGGAAVAFPGTGRIQAKEIVFRLVESPQLRPDQMIANTDVHIDSPQLTGRFEQMEIWFEDAAAGASGGGTGAGAGGPYAGAAASPPSASQSSATPASGMGGGGQSPSDSMAGGPANPNPGASQSPRASQSRMPANPGDPAVSPRPSNDSI